MVSKGVVKSLSALRFILERGFTKEVPETVIKSAISIEIGTHYTTVNSYLDLFKMLGVIRPYGPSTYVIDLDKILQLVQLVKMEGIETRDLRKVEDLVKEAMVGGTSNAE